MQIGYTFLFLTPGENFNRFSWKEMPMPDRVIFRVEQLVMRDQELAALYFTSELGLFIRDLHNNPGNEVDNKIRDPIVKWVDEHDVEQ